MSSTLNSVNLIGFVGAKPDIKTDIKNSNTGIVATISIGVKEKFKNKDGSYTERTDWVKITSFGKAAKYVAQYISTGDLVLVVGKLKNNVYTDRKGKKHSELYVLCSNISLLRKKEKNPEVPQQQQNEVVTNNGRNYIQQTNRNNSSDLQQQKQNNDKHVSPILSEKKHYYRKGR